MPQAAAVNAEERWRVLKAQDIAEREVARRRMDEEYKDRAERLKRREEEAVAAQQEAAGEERVRRDMALREAASHEKKALGVKLGTIQ